MILLHRYELFFAKYFLSYGLSRNISQLVDRDIQGFDDMNGKRFTHLKHCVYSSSVCKMS